MGLSPNNWLDIFQNETHLEAPQINSRSELNNFSKEKINFVTRLVWKVFAVKSGGWYPCCFKLPRTKFYSYGDEFKETDANCEIGPILLWERD